MIEYLDPVRFDRVAHSGRTKPAFITCEDAGGIEVEVIAKLSHSCDGVDPLSKELICACLAGDLGLPVPQPYIVDLTIDWVESITDIDWRLAAQHSVCHAFGSKKLPTAFNAWMKHKSNDSNILQMAASILLFDSIIDNYDRRYEKPNCLFRGSELRIIDHELAFNELIIGWKAPWELGSLDHLSCEPVHIFIDFLKGKNVAWQPIIDKWKILTDMQLDNYISFIPQSWNSSKPRIERAINQVKNARDNIEDCTREIQRVLT